MNSLQEKKIVDVVSTLLDKYQGKVNVLLLMKLIWAADRYHLRKYGRTITGDFYVAMKLGPVASITKDLIDATVINDSDTHSLAEEYFQRNGVDLVSPVGG